MLAPPRTEMGPPTTSRPTWHQPGPHSQLSTPPPPLLSKFGGHPNRHRPSSKKRWHATIGLLHTSGDAPFIHPYRTSTSLPTMRGPSTSSCPTTPRSKQGKRQHASPNSSPAPCSTTPFQHQTSSSPTVRAATTTTSTPSRSAPPSPYTPLPRTLTSNHHGTTCNQHGSIHRKISLISALIVLMKSCKFWC